MLGLLLELNLGGTWWRGSKSRDVDLWSREGERGVPRRRARRSGGRPEVLLVRGEAILGLRHRRGVVRRRKGCVVCMRTGMCTGVERELYCRGASAGLIEETGAQSRCYCTRVVL